MGDLQIHKPEIVKQISGEENSPQDTLNNTIEDQKRLIADLIKKDFLKDGISQEIVNKLKFDSVGNIGVVINSKGKIHSLYKYSKINGVEFYVTTNYIFKENDSSEQANKVGYDINNGKIYKKGVEIPQFLTNGNINPEFVKVVDNISFMLNMRYTYGIQNALNFGMKLEGDDDMTKEIKESVVSGVMRIKDIIFYAEKGYVPESEIPILLTRAIQELPNQCSDIRFYQDANGIRIGAEVTKDELDQYLKPTEGKPLITQKMYEDCLKRIEARDRKINEIIKKRDEKNEKRENIKKQTQSNLIQEKSEFNV